MKDAEVDELIRRLRILFARLHPKVPLLVAQRIPVRNQWHLGEAFNYALRQDKHHGMGADPFQEGSAVCDLLGMRVLGTALAERVQEHLPRVESSALIPHLRVDVLEEGTSLAHLLEAACAAFALPDLTGRDDDTVFARLAAVHAMADAPAIEVAAALGMHRRSVYRCRTSDVDPAPAHVTAVRLQMGLRIRAEALRARARPEVPARLAAPL